jgi:uncharacterized phiE125 gp8 family phage protein
MPAKLITPPLADPVTLADAKAHLYVSHADDDDIIKAYVAAAREDAEHRLGRALVRQTWELVLDGFEPVVILPNPPLIGVVSIKYLDTAGVEQTLDAADYYVDSAADPGEVVPASGLSWPSTLAQRNSVRIRYLAGYTAQHAITAIAKTGGKAVVTIGAHDVIVGQRVHFTGVEGMVEINGVCAEVLAVTATTVTVNVNTSTFSDYTGGGTLCVDLVPEAVKAWIKLRVGALYENRESAVSGQPIQAAPRDFADALLDRHKVYS